ncbi:MAG TPA: hypothetical protein DCG75_02820 [Bacteroidales bacterium]|jgi:hypothetical protein|nr:hypothetical protein [Bacteroidales bacterium]
MKNKSLFWITIILLGVLGFSSCSDEATNKSPFFESITLSDDNKTATVTFSEPVYANIDETGNLENSDILVTITGVDFTYEVTHTAGATTMTIDLTITSITEGTETVTVQAASATSIYDAEGKAMEVTEMITSANIAEDLGIIGNWYSAGVNVAPLLVAYMSVDSIYAEFKDDYSYLVEQYNIGNTSGTPDINYTGTFVIEKSTIDEIWTIVLNQVTPSEGISEGIYEIKTSPEVLWYEVALTTGTQNVPPTPEGGFGSTNGGTLVINDVNWNLQKFIRITE